MPDWFYRTVTQPLLFRLPAETSRACALGAMGTLAKLPGGPQAIDFLGHMRPDERLACRIAGLNFPTRLGLGPRLDPGGMAWPALARFGFGFLEVGPVSAKQGERHSAVRQPNQCQRDPPRQAILFSAAAQPFTAAALRTKLAPLRKLDLRVLVRIAEPHAKSLDELIECCMQTIRDLRGTVDAFTLDVLSNFTQLGASPINCESALSRIIVAAQEISCPVFLCIPTTQSWEEALPFLHAAIQASCTGVLIDGIQTTGNQQFLAGKPGFSATLQFVERCRQEFGPTLTIIANGGAHEPADTVALRAAGADLVQLDTGLIYSGPGLPKRCNSALLETISSDSKTDSSRASLAASNSPLNQTKRPAEMTWFWTLLMGGGMFAGSLLALAIASTRVILPYDEAFVGLSRAQLDGLNPRLLAFLTHDRVTLAGTMIAIGILYVSLSWNGIRKGEHWAMVTVFVSAFIGFASFFTFLGFGYLDPFHAFVTLVLLQLLLLGVRSHLGGPPPIKSVPLCEDWRWRWSLWGQLLAICHGVALLAAGMTITFIGCTSVLVHEDLDFMQTTAARLTELNPRILPLIAHDRATFGGMLLSSGAAFLLPALWGWNYRVRWLWLATMLAGIAGYLPAIAVHFAVGYTDWGHLLPAFAGLQLFLISQLLGFPYLWGIGEATESAKK